MGSGLGTSDVSVIIPTEFKRKEELNEIMAYLGDLGFEDIILPEGPKRLYNRYEAIRGAKHPIIYTQDDDCIVRNIPALLEAYSPARVVANTKLERKIYYERVSEGRVALVGFGAVFHKGLVKSFDRYFELFPEDDLLYREADRVFTWLNDVRKVVADVHIDDFPSSLEGLSMDRDHFTSLYIMIDRLKQL